MSKVGKLLIAHPNLPKDNWFHKTVVYIYLDNDSEGTFGVALNVKTTLQIKKLCYQRGVLYPDNVPSVYKGGPVADHTVMMLHTDEWICGNTVSAGNRYSITSDDRMFETLALGHTPAYWRMFLGMCGWRPGQLDMELSGTFPYKVENSWLTCDANDSIMFESDGEKQWELALKLSRKQMINSYF